MIKNYEPGQSREDYLETILMIQQQKGKCYSIDVANKLNFSKPSVSVAVKKLESENYIYRDKRGVLYLTEEGKKIADETLEKHHMLTTLLEQMGVPADIAENDACKIEHHLSKETYDAIKSHYTKFVK